MKKLICSILLFLMLDTSAFALGEYEIIDMSEFENVMGFSEGFCAVQDKSTLRWGYIDENKNWVIEPQFRNGSWFKNANCATNTIDGETVVINKKGEICLTRQAYRGTVDSDITFVTSRGDYMAVWDKQDAEEEIYAVQLVNDNKELFSTGFIKLFAFQAPNEYSERSKSFYHSPEGIIYNYKCENITDRLMEENIGLDNKIIANDKYIVGAKANKVKCFDIDGNMVAEFEKMGERFSLIDDLLVCDGNVYSIPEQKKLFDSKGQDIDMVRGFYNKYFTVKKKYGTTALYSWSGDIIVDFGIWNNIYPSYVSDRLLVSAGNWGVVDHSGNIILPLEYSHYGTDEPFCGDGRYARLIENGGYVYIDLLTLKKKSVFGKIDFGYKYHRYENEILNSELDTIYVAGENEKIESVKFLSDGNVKISKKNGVKQEYKILKFKDNGVKVLLNDNLLRFDVFPMVQDGRTLVPMRTIFESLGANVEWEAETQSIKAIKNDIVIELQLGNNILVKNGEKIELDVCPQAIDGRTLVPLRAISNSLDVDVYWAGETKTVSLYTK